MTSSSLERSLLLSKSPSIQTEHSTHTLQFQFGFHHLIFSRVLEVETKLLAHFLHALVFGQDVPGEALELFIAAHPYQPAQQFGPQPLVLVLVGDEHGKLSLICVMGFDKAPNAKNLLLVGLRIDALGNQRDLPVVIKKADADQPLVGHPLAQPNHVQPAEIDTLVRKGFVKFDHERLILRANATNPHRPTVTTPPPSHTLP